MTSDISEKVSRIFDRAKGEALLILESAHRQLISKPVVQNDADQEAEALRVKISRISAKDFISVKEAAILLSCSDGHIRNLVDKARKGKTAYPIPFLDLDGVTTLPRAKLLEWAETPKRRLRAAS